MFRFSIRDVLWLTVVVAMGAAWWVDRTAVYRDMNDARAKAEMERDYSREILRRLNRSDQFRPTLNPATVVRPNSD